MKLKGLNIRRNKAGKWYVSYRMTGKLLGSAPTRAALDALIAGPDFLVAYTRARSKEARSYATGTFGDLVGRWKASTDWSRLADRTRKDYAKVLLFLEPMFDYAASEIELADVVELRDQAAKEHNPAFSGFVIAVMSSVFRHATEKGLVKHNPAKGVRRLYRADPDANRRWTAKEWETVSAIAPAHLRPVLSIARWCGLRGQDVAALTWASYRDDPDMGKALIFTPRKNGDKVGEIAIGVPAELRAILDAMKAGDGKVQPASNAPICRNSRGRQYPSENAMRGVWQAFKQSERFKAALPNSGDLTLHGLRVTFSSELREAGHSDREVADMLGDLSEGMGKRYSRGAEMRKTSVRVFRAMAR